MILTSTFIILSLFAVMAIGYYSYSLKAKERVVVENVSLTQSWQEFTINPPLTVQKIPYQNLQNIRLYVEDREKWDYQNLPKQAFIMPDGTLASIDLELVDESGEVYMLDELSLGVGLGFTYLPEKSDSLFSNFPKDSRFSLLRIRSETPVEISKISWITSVSK